MARRQVFLFLTSLRARLVLLVVLALLPATLFLGEVYRERRATVIERMDAEALRTIGLVATQGTDVFDGARRALVQLTRAARLENGVLTLDHTALARALEATPSLVTITVFDRNGLVLNQALTSSSATAGRASDGTVPLTAMAEHGFVIGHYDTDSARSASLVTCAMPVMGPNGETWGAVSAVLSQEWLVDLLRRMPMEKGAALVLADERGIVLSRIPDGARSTGTSILRTPLFEAMRAEGAKSAIVDSFDKVSRRFAFATFGTGASRVYVAYGIPVHAVMSGERNARTRDALLLLALIVATVLAAWFWSSALIVAPVRDLIRVAHKLRRGDFTARSRSLGSGELGQLSRLVDDMADHIESTIAERDASVVERENVVRALRHSEEQFRLLVDAVEDYAICMLDPDGCVVSWNAGAARITGFTAEESIGEPYSRIFPLPEVARGLPSATLEQAAIQGSLHNEGWRCRKDGTQFFAYEVLTALHASDGHLSGFSLITRDISALRLASEARDVAEAELRASNDRLEHSVSELERHLREIGTLNELSDRLQASNDAAEVTAAVTRTCQSVFAGSAGALFLLDPTHSLAEVAASWGGPFPAAIQMDDCWALRSSGTAAFLESENSLPPCPHAEGHGFARTVCVRLQAREEVLGVLHIGFPATAHDGSPKDQARRAQAGVRLAEAISKQVGLALANIRLKDSLRGQALRDPLTDLFNRRYMEETLEREVSRSVRKGTPLSVIMLDLDNFKIYNDTHGHHAGDAVLREVATFLQSHVRGEDVACRYGGEEFTLILPGATRHVAERRARQILRGLRDIHVRSGLQALPSVTASFGIAVFPDNGVTASDLVQAADAALYQAKSAGRDCIALATPGSARVA